MSKFAPHRRGINNPPATSTTVCQKCLGKGHYTYECKSTRPYVSRPSRTQQLESPALSTKLKEAGPSLDLPDEFKTRSGTANRILEGKERQRAEAEANDDKARPKKKPRRSRSRSSSSRSSSSGSSSSDSSASSSDSDSGSGSNSSSERSRSRSSDGNRRRPRRSSRSSSGRN